MTPDQVRIITPRDGDDVDVLGAPIRIKSAGRADQLFFADHPMPAGYAVPMHVHETEDELFYILDGELTLMGEAGETVAGAGSFVHLPRGVPHGFRNAGDREIRMLVITTPGGSLEGVFRGLDAAAARGPLDPPAIAAITAANAVQMLL